MPSDIPLAEQIEAVRSCLSMAERAVQLWHPHSQQPAYLDAIAHRNALRRALETLVRLQTHIDGAAAL